jgi:hypothetical protein
MIGGKILESQLQKIGVLGVNDAIRNHPAFDTNYKICKYYFDRCTDPCLSILLLD